LRKKEDFIEFYFFIGCAGFFAFLTGFFLISLLFTIFITPRDIHPFTRTRAATGRHQTQRDTIF
jgi:hypothetical protein